MSDIPSAANKIQIESTQQRAAVSEFTMQTIGGSVNYSLDQIAAILTKSFLQVGTVAQLNLSGSTPFTYTVPTGGLFVAIVLINTNFSHSFGAGLQTETGVDSTNTYFLYIAGGGSAVSVTNNGGQVTYFTLNSTAV